MDERGLIQAVCGGFQDRLEDLRSYGKKMQLFFSVYGLPDPENNVVSVVLTSQQGKVYKRSLDITDDTPPASNNTALRQWAAIQLGLEESTLGVVQYDRDLLRLVDTSTLEYLAASIGAILYQSSLVSDQRVANQQLVDTYFPRLKIKGTAQSFDVLGRALGFDDVRVTPLWSRMSPRRPEDVGNPLNDPDYLSYPEFYPRQQISVLYDPLAVRDGPFYGWTGTCSNGTASTSFYTSAINGFNPWVQVIVLGSIANGTAAHVAAGSYTLASGAPNLNAYVEPSNSSFRFEALVEGAAMNGVVITVGTFGYSGTDRTVSIYDRLSSVKYRSSYFDLGLTVDIDRAEEVFGTQPASRNPDIASGNYTPDGVSGTAVSPYRAWRTGSIAVTTLTQDFYTETVVSAGTTVVHPRVQSAGTNQEIIVDNLIDAGVQVTQSLEEVRPATRFPRRTASGLLIDDSTHFACYVNAGTLFTTSTGSVYSGSHPLTPLGGYTAALSVHLGPSFAIDYQTVLGRSYTVWGTPDFVLYVPVAVTTADMNPETFVVAMTGTSAFFVVKDTLTGSVVPQTPYLINNAAYDATAAVDPSNGTIWDYRFDAPNITNLVYNGTYNFGNGTYFVDFPMGAPPAARAVAIWTVTDSEVIRPEPTRLDKNANRFNCQVRPEDDDNGLLDEQVDDYPWLREVVGGGEQVEIDTYIPEGVPVDVVDYQTAFQNQSGVDVDVYGFESQNKRLRTRVQDRPYDGDYQPGIRAIGYSGSFRNLATLSGSEISLIIPASGSATGTYAAPTEYDILFNSGYALYHVGVIEDVLVADPVKFYGSHHRTGLVGWMPLNEHPEENLDVRDVARTIPVEKQILAVHPEDRVWDSQRGYYLDLQPDGQVLATVTRGLGEDFTMSFWLRPGQNLADVRIVSYDPVFIDLNQLGSQLRFYAKDINGTEILLGVKGVNRGEFNFVTITKNAERYRFGVGNLTTPVALTDYTGLFSPFDEVNNSTLILKAPTSANQSALTGLQELDIFFFIDYSGSMVPSIAALVANLATFDAALTADGFDVRYGFSSFGLAVNAPHYSDLVQNMTDFTTFMATLTPYTPAPGGTETGSYAIVTQLPLVTWRSTANRLVILFTDENDDSGPAPFVGPPDPGSAPNPAVIAGAYTQLTLAGAIFYTAAYPYSAPIANSSLDPTVYINLANAFNGKVYSILAFLISPLAMLNDIANLAVANFVGGTGFVGFHDFRLWKLTKTVDDLNLVRYHQPVPTSVQYQMGFIETANRQDRYGLKMLESAWMTPDVMPPWYRTSRTGLVRRYTSDGSYAGASRFKEVGLGDGHALPSQMFLGYVVPCVEVGGTAVSSGSWGALPGVNNLWATDTTTLYPMEQCNPVRDRIWVRGLEDGAMYEVALSGQATRTFVTGTAAYNGTNIWSATISMAGTSSQQLTGAEVVLAAGGQICYWGTSAGTLVQVADSGGTQTPPQWMYLNQRTTDSYPGLPTHWTKQGYTAHQQGVDITGNPDVVVVPGNVNSALLVAALGNNGRLDFENTSVFGPARYRLTLETGNIGPTDEDFDGFTVELNLNENIIEAVLLRGQSGFNVRGTDVIEFVTNTPPVNGTWLLSIQWFNALRDTAKGTMRQLAVYSYKVEKLATEIFRIEVNPAGTRPEIVPVAFCVAPGGWLVRVNSYGTVVESAHEGTIYPANDTLVSKLPLSDLLTGMTNDKREDVLVSVINPPSFWTAGTVATDPAPPVMPTFGVLIDTLV